MYRLIGEKLEYYTHDINPVAFSIFGTPIAWYWLAYLFGFFFVYFMGIRIIKTEKIELNTADFSDYMGFGWIGLIVFTRLFYVVFYNLNFYIENPVQIFYIWNGGMSFHGGLVGLALTIFLVSHLKKKSAWPFFDLVAILAPFALGVGRVTNFINGELAGRTTDVSWAIIFPRYNDLVPRHPSQLYQAALEGFILFIILYKNKEKLRLPGTLSSYFLIGYGTFRFFTEFFREPDAQLGFIFLNLSMGQLMCVLMIAGGFMLKKTMSRQVTSPAAE